MSNTQIPSSNDSINLSTKKTLVSMNGTNEFDQSDLSSETAIELPRRKRGRPLKNIDKIKVTNEFAKLDQAEIMEQIKAFAKLTMSYSEHLKKKIEMKTSRLFDGSKNKEKETVSVSTQLKYFEGGTLHPYQVEGVTWLTVLFENSVNGILADEMGLGKTIQVIALICHLYERNVNGPHLIVVPLSVLGTWMSEFKKFAPQIPCVRLQGDQTERKEQIKQLKGTFTLGDKKVSPVIICSYQIPHMEKNFLRTLNWVYIIVDEAHKIKNPKTILSLELRDFQSENRLLLTGTPLQNNIKELWSLFNFLMPEMFGNIERFASLINLDDLQDKEKILQNEAKNKLISTIHNVLAPFMLRREKKLVFGNFVPKKEILIYCPLTELQTYLYKLVLRGDYRGLKMLPPTDSLQVVPQKQQRRCKRKIDYSELYYKKRARVDSEQEFDFPEVREAAKSESRSRRVVTNRYVPVKCPDTPYICRIVMQRPYTMLGKIVNHPYLVWYPLNPASREKELYVSEDLIKCSGKLMVLDALLSKLKAEKHKVLIFSTSTMYLDLIEDYMSLRDFKYRRLDGTVKFYERNSSIDDFMTDPDIFIFLLSTRAGGLGLNLTAADTAIFMDRDWNPMADMQAQDRCHRIGQTKPVMIYSLVTKNTIDEVIVTKGDLKKRLEKLIIKEGEFKSLCRNRNDDGLQELENLLNNEEQSVAVNSNGLFYTDKEFDQILDRSELYEQIGLDGTVYK